MDGTSPIDYYGQTVLHPVGLAAVLLLGSLMLALPRRHAVAPMLAMACFVPPAQRIAVLSLNFDLLRIMVLFGTVRLLFRREIAGIVWNRVDTCVLLWAAVSTVVYSLQYQDAVAIKNRLGFAYDAVGMYFLFRMLVRDLDDIRRVATMFAGLSVPVAVVFCIEHVTGRNMFSIMGGVPEITAVRGTRLRCQGAFAHPILAGCFWASAMPLMAALWRFGVRPRRYACIGLGSSLLIVVFCASSTPVMAVVFGAIAMASIVLRHHLRIIRWSTVALLAAMQLFMQNPVWHLVARLDVVGGSTGWHRYHLIDEAVNHAAEWWLLGTRSTGGWGYGLQDVTNQYVLEGVRGGMISLCLFLAAIVAAFRAVGHAMRTLGGSGPSDQVLLWALGTSLFVHCLDFLGVSYFGQITMLWYLTLAMASCVMSVAAPGQPYTLTAQREAVRVLRSRTQRRGSRAPVPCHTRPPS